MEIRTNSGLLQGVEMPECIIYKGIPYAKPPVGELRWKAPQPYSWEGVRKADHFGGRCLQRPRQSGSFYDKEFGGEEEEQTPLTEDCLYLNIWTPKNCDGKKLPVAVWIHGGAFLGGSGHEIEFDGTTYAKKDVILVTINYRLGVWGYLAHPWLSEESEAHVSGNYGVMDQIFALKWVKENIQTFGGDPENVTVFGQSAGALSVLVLISSELTKGLFSKAILQSGMGLHCTYTQAEALADGEEFTANAKVNSLEELRALPADQVNMASGPLIMKGFRNNGVLVYEPNLDGYILPGTYEELQKQGRVHKIPYIIGSNKNDMRTIPEAVATGDLGPMYEGVKFFASNVSANQEEPVYAYYFKRDLPGDDAGAFHSAELWYTFGSIEHCWRPMEEGDYALAEKMSTAWTNFMKTGDPGWKSYDQEEYIHVWDADN